MELQTPSQDSVSFYDDTGIYWALQLEKTEESVPLARLLLAAKAASSGAIAMVELKGADTEAAPCSLRLAAVSHRSLLQSETQAMVPSASSFLREQLESADACWGSGAARALEGQLAGSVALLAVPPGSQTSLRCDDSVLLLEVVAEGLSEADRPVEISQDTKRLSVKERMAKLAAASLPPGAIGMMPLAEGDVEEKVGLSNGRPKDPVLAGPGVCSSPPRPAHPGPLPVNQSGLQNGHPSAEIIRQYWSAVQESGSAPYAYLGALPFVPGLTRMPIASPAVHSTHGAAAIAETAKGFAGPVPPMPSMPMTMPTGPEALEARVGTMGSVPLSSVSMGEFMASMRDLVRAEATPEGWQAERQKLERRVSLLEEQLRSSKVHQVSAKRPNDSFKPAHSALHFGARYTTPVRTPAGVPAAYQGVDVSITFSIRWQLSLKDGGSAIIGLPTRAPGQSARLQEQCIVMTRCGSVAVMYNNGDQSICSIECSETRAKNWQSDPRSGQHRCAVFAHRVPNSIVSGKLENDNCMVLQKTVGATFLPVPSVHAGLKGVCSTRGVQAALSQVKYNGRAEIASICYGNRVRACQTSGLPFPQENKRPELREEMLQEFGYIVLGCRHSPSTEEPRPGWKSVDGTG
ncbi:unnamed protein product [Symbiodinium sp. CCMP2592]|nr:unnamed protein product [Symbiodinium sp. CCMP2592]